MAELNVPAAPEAPPGFPYEEKRARAALGLHKDDMRALRKAKLSTADWTVYKKRVYLSHAALQAIAAAVQAPSLKKNAPASQIERRHDPDPATALPVTLRVVRTDLANDHLLLACDDDDDPDHPKRPLRVRVRTTAHFVRGMQIPARLVPGYDDLYELTRPLPRKKGKW